MKHPMPLATLGADRWVKSSTGWRRWNGHDWVPSAPPPAEAVLTDFHNREET